MRNVVLAVDPGLAHVGLCVVHFLIARPKVLHVATLASERRDGIDCERLDVIAREVHRLAVEHRPEALAYEDQSGVEVGMQRAGTGSNHSSRRLHEVCGMVRGIAAALGLPSHVVHASTAKKALTGSGRASKEQVVAMAQRVYGIADLSEHGADALAIAIAAHRAIRSDSLRLSHARNPLARDPHLGDGG